MGYRELGAQARQSLRDREPVSWTSIGDIPHDFEVSQVDTNGFSDTVILKLTSEHGTYAIRSWPDDPVSLQRICFWNALVEAYPTKPPFPRTVRWNQHGLLFPYQSKRWSLCDWVEGRSIQPEDISIELIERLAIVLGELHSRTLTALESPGVPLQQGLMRSSSLEQRRTALGILDHRVLEMTKRCNYFAQASIGSMVRQTVESILNRRAEFHRFIDLCSLRPRHCHWIVRDLWHENVLISEQGEFESIVDLGASRMDWPGLDFVRLFGSLIGTAPLAAASNLGDCHSWWSRAFLVYQEIHPRHSLESLEECELLDNVSCALAIVQWVRWITADVFDWRTEKNAMRLSKRLCQLCTQYHRGINTYSRP